ncbi:MAG: ribosome biogenesis GTPase YlqF [Halanaerobiales bacterium]
MINWYPGHMEKAKKKILSDLNLIDVIIEMVDARIPSSSRNEKFMDLLPERNKILVLNKIDLADPVLTGEWLEYFQDKCVVVTVNSLRGYGIEELSTKLTDIKSDLNEKLQKKGRKTRPMRIMVMGIPNVGKSALINVLSGRKKARIGDNPGVTRGKQWINIGDELQLMDTPGILPPALKDEEVAYKLAITGAVKPKQYDMETAGYKLLKYIIKLKPVQIQEYYGVDSEGLPLYELMAEIGKARGHLMSGGKIDRERTGKMLLQDFRSGKLGRISLESPGGRDNEDW